MADTPSLFQPTIPLPFQNVNGQSRLEEFSTKGPLRGSEEVSDLFKHRSTITSFVLPSGESLERDFTETMEIDQKKPAKEFIPTERSMSIELSSGKVRWSRDKAREELEITDENSDVTYFLKKKNGVTTYIRATSDVDAAGESKYSFISREEFIHAASALVGPYDQAWSTSLSKILPPATTQEERLQRLTQKTAQLNITTDGTCAIIREPVSDKSILAYCQQQPKLDKKSHGQFRPDAFYQAGDERGRKTIAANFKEDPKLQKSLSPEMLEQIAQRIASGAIVHIEHSSTPLNLSAPRQMAQGKSDDKTLPPKR